MRTARSLTVSRSICWGGGGSVQPPLDVEPPDADPPGCRHPWMQTPPNRMTDRRKNITLLQTLFAGGNNVNTF